MTLFQADSLTCVRGERCVFETLSFSMDAGDALLLIGPNGSGKSSLLRILAGLLPPRGGHLLWSGEDVREDPEAHRRRLHYLGHADPIKPVLTVAENLRFWRQVGDADTDGKDGPADAPITGALATFGIDHLADLPGRFLSAGQKRRANLARLDAIPRILWLLDEPATALDRETSGRLRDLIDRHRDAGGLVIASTHTDLGFAASQTLDLGAYQARNPLDIHAPLDRETSLEERAGSA